MVQVVLARHAAGQLTGQSLSNALRMPAELREKAQLRAANIVKSLDQALERYDGSHSKCTFALLAQSVQQDTTLTSEELMVSARDCANTTLDGMRVGAR